MVVLEDVTVIVLSDMSDRLEMYDIIACLRLLSSNSEERADRLVSIEQRNVS